jgi:plastocyanin
MAWRGLAVGMAAAMTGGLAMPALAARHTVVIEGMQFTPAALVVRRGDTVVWVNRDLVAHTATAGSRFDSGSIAANASWSFVARKRGRFDYLCTLHPMMKATLVVQ